MTDQSLNPDGQEPLDPQVTAALEDILGSQSVWAGLDEQVEAAIIRTIAAEVHEAELGQEPIFTKRDRRYLIPIGAVAGLFLIAGIAIAVFFAGEDPTRVELAATDVAPAASAVAEIEDTPSGLRVVLEVEGLPAAEPGTYYQGWVRSDTDGVSIGTFHMRGGDADVELWAGVTAEDYPVITVTLQQEGEGPQGSGVVVLKGRLDS
jgi:hypothetical protein